MSLTTVPERTKTGQLAEVQPPQLAPRNAAERNPLGQNLIPETELVATRTVAWIKHPPAFDSLGRYEARRSSPSSRYEEEFERPQAERKEQELAERSRSHKEMEGDKFNLASFFRIARGPLNTPGSCRILRHLTPPHLIEKACRSPGGNVPESTKFRKTLCGREKDFPQDRPVHLEAVFHAPKFPHFMHRQPSLPLPEILSNSLRARNFRGIVTAYPVSERHCAVDKTDIATLLINFKRLHP